MIRFRSREDERRYFALLTQVSQTMATHVPPDQLSQALRSFAKLQDMLLLEGVRQGVAAAAISNVGKTADGHDLEGHKAFQLHAHVYGSQDTPLRAVELEWLTKLGAIDAADTAWLDPNPMRFAPEPEERSVLPTESQTTVASIREYARKVEAIDEDADASIEEIETLLDAEPVQAEPELLDRVRDALLQLSANGYRAGNWPEMIMRLHLMLQMDAGYIDLMLGSAQGHAVLEQTGYAHVSPNALGFNLQSLQDEINVSQLPKTE